MLCRSTHTRLVITIPHVQEIRKYKHQHKHDNQLIYRMKDYIPEDHSGYQRLVAAIRLVGKDVM